MPYTAVDHTGIAQHAHVRARMPARLLTTAALLGLVFATVAGLVLRESWNAYQARVTETAESLAAVAQVSLAAEFSKIDAVLQATQDQLRTSDGGVTSDDGINATLRGHRLVLPELEALRVADVDGKVRWGNDLPAGMPIDISDREYFKRASALQHSELVVSGPIQSRASGHWIIVLVRPMTTDGRFDGIVYATVATDHLDDVLRRFELSPGDAITLRTSELALVARHAPGSVAQPVVGAVTVSPELKAALARDPARGSFTSTVALDRVERTTAYRGLEGLPLLVLTGLSHERFFLPWRNMAFEVSALAVLAWLLTCTAMLTVYRVWSREVRLATALAAQTHRTRALLRIAGDGIHIINSAGRLVEVSDSFVQMLRSSRDKLIGRHISTWDANMSESQVESWLARAKDGDRVRADVQHLTDDGRTIDVDLHVSVADIEGERFIFASARDITERKRLQADLEKSSATIRDLYDNAPCGYHSLDSQGVFVHVNATMLRWLGCTEGDLLHKAKLTDFLDAAGQAIFAQNFPKLMRDGRLDGIEFTLSPRNAPQRFVRGSVAAVLNDAGEFVRSRSVLLDVTDLHQAQLESARLLLDQTAMLDNEIVGMAKLTRGVIVWKNRALDRMFGYASGELGDSSIDRLFPNRQAYEAVAQAATTVLATGSNFRAQLQMKRSDGEIIWVDLSGVQLGNDLTFWMMADITAMRRSHERIEHIAFHDELTGLPNRLLLNDRFRQAMSLVDREGGRVAVCYLDLDGFKPVNDLHGHDAGDALLAEIAQRLGQAVRGLDTVARIGGDEFVVLLLLDEHADDASTAVQRLLQTVTEPVVLQGGVAVQVGMSIGLAVYPKDGTDAADVLAKADQALLQAKRLGKGRVCAYGVRPPVAVPP